MMYGPDEDDRIEGVERRVDDQVWLLLVALGLLALAFAWGIAAPVAP